MKEETTHIRIKKELRKKLKIKAAELGKTMQDLLEKWIKERL